MLEETDDANATQVRYTTADSSYFAPLLHFKRSDRSMRYPLYDATGSVLRVVDGSATVTDSYTLDSFGRQLSGTPPGPLPPGNGGSRAAMAALGLATRHVGSRAALHRPVAWALVASGDLCAFAGRAAAGNPRRHAPPASPSPGTPQDRKESR